MNVLLIVTTMIMIMASLTYARLEIYRSLSLRQAEFERYMNTTERGYINSTAEWWYDNSKAEIRGSSSNPQTRTDARSHLSFLIFVDNKQAAKHAKEYPKLYYMAKKLIVSLYKDQPFFQEFVQLRPDIVDALLRSLIKADGLPNEQKLKKAPELANLDLGDPVLDSFLYFILKGLQVEEEEKKTDSGLPPLMEPLIQEEEGEVDDEVEEPNHKEAFKSPKGYRSLLDFIALDDAVKIRVYLASKELLTAIFDNKDTVDAIMAARTDLYKKVIAGLDAPQASAQFKSLFASKSDPMFDDTVLDFTVSKTNPKKYE